LSEEWSLIEIILQDSRDEKELMEEYRGYGNSYLLQYLENWGDELNEETKEFLKKVEVLGEKELIELKEKGLDLLVENDPHIWYYWPALMPRLFLKMVHIFGHPTIRSTDGGKTFFTYLFKYKGHIIEVRDKRGAILFLHMTPHPVGKKDIPPQEGAEEILKEFAENLIWMALNVTPLNYSDRDIWL